MSHRRKQAERNVRLLLIALAEVLPADADALASAASDVRDGLIDFAGGGNIEDVTWRRHTLRRLRMLFDLVPHLKDAKAFAFGPEPTDH
jgi:hypothetical protein